ncbi:hypothetical protein [Komarekiella delphini-convector]|uniref:hypothetical protein n=1 Tax=Komarekiella delphini-convector TaxID=3050158 RepID=UPI0017803074|nr:hypothetical protein [Komarekiella delphini-convector]
MHFSVYDFLGAVNSQQSTVNSQQSTVNSQQSTVNSQQSTVNSQQLGNSSYYSSPDPRSLVKPAA